MRKLDIHLSMKSVCYIHRKQKIIKDVNLELQGPKVVTFLGPNGAGKSTLLKLFALQLLPDSGAVHLDSDVTTFNQMFNQIGYMPEVPCVLPELTVKEYLLYSAFNRNVTDPIKAIDQVVEDCRLHSVLDKNMLSLSMGYKQRTNLAQAIIHQPHLLVLDEPLNGLDPQLMMEFRALLKKLKQNSLILMSTHYLAEAEQVSDEVVILQEGQIQSRIEDFSDLESDYIQSLETSL